MGSEDEFSKKLQGLKSFIGDIEQDYKNSIKGYKESIEGYESRINELENICGQQNKVMTELHIKLREKDKWFLKSTEQGYKQRAKTSEMSYLVIGGSGKIIASTDAFKEQFHFTEYKLIGESYFSVLKIPEDSTITNKNEAAADGVLVPVSTGTHTIKRPVEEGETKLNYTFDNQKTKGAKENMFDKRKHLGLPSWWKDKTDHTNTKY